MRRGIQVRTKVSNSLRRSHVVETQSFIQRILLGGSHVAAAGDHIGVASFDLEREIQKLPHHFLHFRHQRWRDLVVHHPEASPFLACFSQFLQLLREFPQIYRRDPSPLLHLTFCLFIWWIRNLPDKIDLLFLYQFWIFMLKSILVKTNVSRPVDQC